MSQHRWHRKFHKDCEPCAARSEVAQQRTNAALRQTLTRSIWNTPMSEAHLLLEDAAALTATMKAEARWLPYETRLPQMRKALRASPVPGISEEPE